MTSSLLTLVQRVQSQLGLFNDLALTVTGATDDTTMQLYSLINDLGDELAQMRDWRTLESEAIISISAPVTTTGDTTLGSAVVTNIPDTSAITAGTFLATAAEFVQAPRVLSVDSATQVTLQELATATTTGTAIVFGQDTYAVPADFRHFVNGTAWDRTQRWQLLGPVSPQEDQWMRSGVAATGPRRRYRQVGRGTNTFRLWPQASTSGSPATLVFDYISAYWATDSTGVAKAQFTDDTDVCVFPDNVVTAGLTYRFMLAKGFDIGPWGQRYMQARDIAMAQDGGARTLNMGRKRWPILLSGANIPDVGYGQ
jgi:hypothetical protein